MEISQFMSNDIYHPSNTLQLVLKNRNDTPPHSSSISLRPSPFSLACRVKPPVLNIINQCHPSFQIFYVYTSSGSYTLQNAIENDNIQYLSLSVIVATFFILFFRSL
ncbi:hypothetical protein HMI54_013833 [Coelomomyces lativittatus]|nr:hypothetical protein HMI54_013833 [Coelomomyces lativittatus]